MRPWEIEKLNRFWVAHVIRHPRNPKTGDIIVRAKSDGPTLTAEQAFRNRWKQWGIPDWRLDQLWAEERRKGNNGG